MGNPAYTTVPAERASDAITELALDLRWSWNHTTDDLWRELDPELWDATRNPWLILQAVSREKLDTLLSEPRYRSQVEDLLQKKHAREASAAWFQKAHPASQLTGVAYFSMEYMLSEALPVYAGGLGNVAGDQLKTASDLGIPVIGIGLLYQQGYFRQEIDSSGAQVARYPFNAPSQLPIRPLRNEAGDWLRLKVTLPGYSLWIRAWQAQIGRRTLFLLDTNDPANMPAFRTITSELYGGGPELRIRQSAVLGIGGWRLLRALGMRPEVCHLNEGHTAFAVLERARSFMDDYQQPFDVALAVTRAGNLFTTHTPVEAGFDRYSPELMEKYFRHYAEARLRISMDDLLALGRKNPSDRAEAFNMAYLAIHGSGAVNGVSLLHGKVSRRLFQPLFPRWPEAEVPIRHVTNGIHVPTWDSPAADALWENACGKERWRGSLEYVEEQIRCVDDEVLWSLRADSRHALVQFVRKKVAQQRAYQGASPEQIRAAGGIFDPAFLTLGFSRRFATYKRPTMLLQDPERLIRILTNPQRPAQLIVAGKAHPQDPQGQAMIKQWNEFVARPEVKGHAVFLSDADMMLAQELVAGVDVWLNTPRRPWEASGTSGMKVLANGGLNCSELDGWWAEAYAPDVGWALGDGRDRGDDPGWDSAEANSLYQMLEQEIIQSFYDRDRSGIPRRWIARVKESMARLTPVFSANRTVRQYTEEFYLPLADAYCARATDGGRPFGAAVAWFHQISSKWDRVHFGPAAVSVRDGKYLYNVQVHLGEISPDDVQVEIYADPLDSGLPFREPLALDGAGDRSQGFYGYSGAVPADRPSDHYTPRAIPRKAGVLVPLEAPLIAWQK